MRRTQPSDLPSQRGFSFTLMLCCTALAAWLPFAACGQSAKEIVLAMTANERTASEHKSYFAFLSQERSDRTHGQMWTERVVETTAGRVRDLLSVEGRPVSPQVAEQEHARLAGDVAHPAEMNKREAIEQGDETHARQMLDLLARGFVLEAPRPEGPDWHIDFRPDGAYSPSSTEEKVLHGMSGFVLVDRRQMRLHHVEGHLPADVSIGFGLLATIRAGSKFMTTKEERDGQWRTVRTLSDIQGKAALFKALSRSQDVTRGEFRRVPDDLSVAQAVALVETPTPR